MTDENKEVMGTGYVYGSEPDAPWIDRDPRTLMPLWRDVLWSRGGAYRVGDDFGLAYDQTTYLADGSTLLVDAYRIHLRPGER